MNRIALTYILVSLLLAAACVGDNPLPPAGSAHDGHITTTELLREGSPEAFAVLGYLNAPDTSADRLHLDLGVSLGGARSVEGIVRGADGAWGTKDDNHFQTVAELAAVAGFDSADATLILLHLDAAGLIPAVVVDGLALDSVQTADVLDVANTWTPDALLQVGIDRQTVAAVVTARPIADVETIAALPRGGKYLVAALLDAAQATGAQPSANLVIDGREFSATTARRLVLVANEATAAQLVREAGLEVRTAQLLTLLRPFANIKALAATKGIDGPELQTLADYSSKWTAPNTGGDDLILGEGFDPSECGDLVTDRNDDRIAVFHDVTQQGVWSDGPRPRAYAFAASRCVSLHNPSVQAEVAARIWDEMETYTSNWSFEVNKGGEGYLALLEISRQRIEERVQAGGGSDESGTVLDVLTDVVQTLASDLAANPGAFVEVVFQGQDGMCAERAVALMNTRTNQILVIHEPSACK